MEKGHIAGLAGNVNEVLALVDEKVTGPWIDAL